MNLNNILSSTITLNYVNVVTINISDSIVIYFSGNISIESIKSLFNNHSSIPVHLLLGLISTSYNNFFIIIKTPYEIFFCVDHISGYPLFYSEINGALNISNGVINVELDYDDEKILELISSGYISRSGTLSRKWERLEAGHYYYRSSSTTIIKQYFIYYPMPLFQIDTKDQYIENLDSVLNNSIDRMLLYASNRRIVIFLSSGIDSRLLLAKIKQRSNADILAITYGAKNFFEKDLAKSTASIANVKWHYCQLNIKQSRDVFLSKERVKYSQWASSLNVIPGYMEYQALVELMRTGIILQNDLIINGQTGDFISGGHIPACLFNGGSRKILSNYYIKKHYSLWEGMNSKSTAYLSNLIVSYIKSDDFIASYEHIEWRERQSKLVMRGQRLYDYLGLDWSLPLWDKEFVNFWATVPYKYKFNQNLMIDYVQQVLPDYFVKIKGVPDLWRGKLSFVPYIAKIIELTSGHQNKESYYKWMSYYGRFYYQYSLFGREIYKKYWRNIRNAGAIIAASYLEDLDLNLDYFLSKFYS